MKAERLIEGPYVAPRFRLGKPAECRYHGTVLIGGVSNGRIPWPLTDGRKPIPILIGDLVRAVETESVRAVAYHWGVSRYTVRRWRRALGVDWFNPGTSALWSECWAKRLKPDSLKKGGRLSRAGKSGVK